MSLASEYLSAKKRLKKMCLGKQQRLYWVYQDISPSIGMKMRMLKNVGKLYSVALIIHVHLFHNIKIDLEYKKSR